VQNYTQRLKADILEDIQYLERNLERNLKEERCVFQFMEKQMQTVEGESAVMGKQVAKLERKVDFFERELGSD